MKYNNRVLVSSKEKKRNTNFFIYIFSYIVTHKIHIKAIFIFFLSLVKYRYFYDMYRHIKLILIYRARCRRASIRLDRIYAMLWKFQGYPVDSTFEGNVMTYFDIHRSMALANATAIAVLVNVICC